MAEVVGLNIDEWMEMINPENMMSLLPVSLLPTDTTASVVAPSSFFMALSRMPTSTTGNVDEKLSVILRGNVGASTQRLAQLVPGLLVELYLPDPKYPSHLRQVIIV